MSENPGFRDEVAGAFKADPREVRSAALEQAARTVEALNLDYYRRDGLDGQRGFSVEAAALIRSLDKRA